jgi:hypothetical protein
MMNTLEDGFQKSSNPQPISIISDLSPGGDLPSQQVASRSMTRTGDVVGSAIVGRLL